jgi:hypothetical protein
VGLQLWGLVCSFCHFFFSGLEGSWGSGCQVLSVLFVCPFRASRDPEAPAGRYCLFFLFVPSGPRRILGFQLADIVCAFWLFFQASRDPRASVAAYWLFSVPSEPRGILGLPTLNTHELLAIFNTHKLLDPKQCLTATATGLICCCVCSR